MTDIDRRGAIFGAGSTVSGWIGLLPSDLSQPTFMTFESGISINLKTGEVTIPPDMSMNDASREFWRGVSEAFPSMFPDRCKP